MTIVVSLVMGSVDLSLDELWQALWHQGSKTNQVIVWQLLLPRVLAALIVGAALGTSGALLQGMLRNPLATPFLLGISAGAGLVVVFLITFNAFLYLIPLAAWIGAVLTTALVYFLARTDQGIGVERLILGGVAISALFGAIQTTLLLLSEDSRIQQALNWLIGSLNGRGWSELKVSAPYIVIALIIACLLSKTLNVLNLGEELLAQSNIAEVTEIEIQQNQDKLEIILKTATGQRLVPLILPESDSLTIEIPDATLALPTGDRFESVNPAPGISEVTAQAIEDNSIRLTITGETQTPSAEILPSSQDLILSVTPEATAQSNLEIDEETDLTITVTGTRTPRPLLDSASSISIIDSEQIDRQLIRDIGDLTRYEPGVSVGRSPSRFGNQDFNIRGIDGNRVLLQIDGVRIPDNFVGRGRDFFDLETIKRVEIIKGPASALYGSDAIGGVVSFITKDPQDYLDIFDNSLYTSVKATYGSSDESISTTGVIAAEDKEGEIQASFVFTTFNGDEFKNGGTARPNPQDINDNTLTGKLVYNLNDNHSFKLTGEIFNSDTDTDLISERGSTPFDVSNPPFFIFFDREDVQAEDTRERRRVSFNYDYDNPDLGWLQAAKLNFYYQDAQIEEDKLSTGVQQDISPMSPPTITPIIRDEVNSFEQDVFGGDVQLQSDFTTGSIEHRLVYGFEVFNTDTS